MKRRQYLEQLRPKDTREIVVIGERVLTCDEFQLGARLRMMPYDELPPEFRALCNEFNVNAVDVAQLAKRGADVEAVRRKIAEKVKT